MLKTSITSFTSKKDICVDLQAPFWSNTRTHLITRCFLPQKVRLLPLLKVESPAAPERRRLVESNHATGRRDFSFGFGWFHPDAPFVRSKHSAWRPESERNMSDKQICSFGETQLGWLESSWVGGGGGGYLDWRLQWTWKVLAWGRFSGRVSGLEAEQTSVGTGHTTNWPLANTLMGVKLVFTDNLIQRGKLHFADLFLFRVSPLFELLRVAALWLTSDMYFRNVVDPYSCRWVCFSSPCVLGILRFRGNLCEAADEEKTCSYFDSGHF